MSMAATLDDRGMAPPAAAGTVGAVVIGGDYQGLGIARSLGRHGVPVCLVDDERSIARFSRHARFSEFVPSLREERAAVETLLAVGRRRGLRGWVLYPTRDETVAALSRYRAELAEFFQVPTPKWDSVQWIWDKRNTYSKARELGLATPTTWYIRHAAELEAIDADPPYVIKPAIKEHFFYATKAKAWRANSRAELRAMFARAAAQVGDGEVMVQDLIPGDGGQQFAYCALYKNGRALASMTVRRTRQHPLEFGRASTYVETVEAPEIEELSLRFLSGIAYYGLVEIEYKLDPRDHRYKLLDVNGRTWGYHTLGAAAGVDFPYLLYADLAGLAVDAQRAKAGVRWIRLVTDLPVGFQEILRGRMRWRDYWASVRRADVEAVFSTADPLPGLAELALLPYLFVKRGF